MIDNYAQLFSVADGSPTSNEPPSKEIELDAAEALALTRAVNRFESAGQDIFKYFVTIERYPDDPTLLISITSRSAKRRMALGQVNDGTVSVFYLADTRTGKILKEGRQR